jgi:predicted deacylase
MTPDVRYRTIEMAGTGVPVIELTGRQDGPRLTVLAGVHGCEYAPMAAVRRWARELADRDIRGSVVEASCRRSLRPRPVFRCS